MDNQTTEQSEPIKAWIREDLYIEFQTKDEVLAFTANMLRFKQFRKAYRDIYGKEPSAGQFRQYRSGEHKERLAALLAELKTSEGERFLSYLKKGKK